MLHFSRFFIFSKFPATYKFHMCVEYDKTKQTPSNKIWYDKYIRQILYKNMYICSFLVLKNACLNYREFDLEGDSWGYPIYGIYRPSFSLHYWNLFAVSRILWLWLSGKRNVSVCRGHELANALYTATPLGNSRSLVFWSYLFFIGFCLFWTLPSMLGWRRPNCARSRRPNINSAGQTPVVSWVVTR